MRLKLGKMTNAELAAWFNITAKSFENCRKKKLKELELFARFKSIRGGVEILEIYEDQYVKTLAENKNKIKEKIPQVWPKGVPDTSKRVGLVIQKELKLPLKASTVIKYTNEGKVELYGKPYMNNGSIGACISLWCKTDGSGVNQKISFFSPEETAIKDKLLKKYFGNADEQMLIIEEMISLGEISKEEAWDVMRELSGFSEGKFGEFKAELEATIGSKTIRATILKDKEVDFGLLGAIEENESAF